MGFDVGDLLHKALEGGAEAGSNGVFLLATGSRSRGFAIPSGPAIPIQHHIEMFADFLQNRICRLQHDIHGLFRGVINVLLEPGIAVIPYKMS
jgi:hypothetical protein